MFSSVFTNKRQAPMIQRQKAEQLLPRFRKVIVPAAGAHFAKRALRTACRMARLNADAEIRLVYLIEVPRAFAIAAMLPGEEALADDVLATGARVVEGFGCRVTTDIQRGREFGETLIKYLAQQDADLLVIGARPDGLRGLPLDLARDIYDRAGIAVILDYNAGDPTSTAAPAPSAH
jgi:nucleotide-binding universal stress UspA family protein